MRFLVVLILALWPVTTQAGGDSATARVVAFLRASDTAATFKVIFTEPFNVLESTKGAIDRCSEIEVHADYRPKWFLWRRSWSKVTKGVHVEALAALEHAHSRLETIRFGMMGGGLRERATKCTFDTRGLAILMESGGTNAVYAHYDPT